MTTIVTTTNDKRQRQRQTTLTALVKEKRKTTKKKRVILSLSLQVYKRKVSQARGIYLYSRGRLPSHPTSYLLPYLLPSIHPILSIEKRERYIYLTYLPVIMMCSTVR